MNLIIGLGNPGTKYQNTRHNAGFMALDRLARKYGFDAPTNFGKSLISKGRIEGRRVVLAWPQTYMNLSGEAAQEILAFYKIGGEDMLVVHDEMDLPPGRIKLMMGGGAAGHNGLTSMMRHVPGNFARLRIGIGRPPKSALLMSSADYVLAPIHLDDMELIGPALDEAVEAAALWLTEGLTKAQNRANKKSPAVCENP